jgi:hypothetical protein
VSWVKGKIIVKIVQLCVNSTNFICGHCPRCSKMMNVWASSHCPCQWFLTCPLCSLHSMIVFLSEPKHFVAKWCCPVINTVELNAFSLQGCVLQWGTARGGWLEAGARSTTTHVTHMSLSAFGYLLEFTPDSDWFSHFIRASDHGAWGENNEGLDVINSFMMLTCQNSFWIFFTKIGF